MRSRLWRSALGAAGTLMVVTAGMHAGGYAPLAREIGASSLPPAWAGGVLGLWIVFSLHLVIVGGLYLAAAMRPEWASRPLILIAGLVPLCDTVVLLVFVGIFIGTISLALCALLVYAGAGLRVASER